MDQYAIKLGDFWRGRDVAGLLLKPPTRHTIVHWNKARELIRRIRSVG